MPVLPDQDDWYQPHPSAYPQTSDVSAAPQGVDIGPLPDVPPGSHYSPTRNRWRSPMGIEFDAGAFRPLPQDRNAIDSQQFMIDRGVLGPAQPSIATTRLRNI